jgi:glycosyltransferase involved in cell wall biosynthesis
MILAALPKTKKVLIIAHNHPNFFPGGAEIFAYDLFKAIGTHTEYKPFFLAAADPTTREVHTGTPFQRLVDSEDEALFWGGSFDYFYQSQQILNFIYLDFKHFLQQLQPDVIHFHHTIRFGVEAIQVARQTLPKVKIVFTIHEFILICHRDGQMVRKDNQELCESASPNRCYRCFPEYSPQQFKMREEFLKAHLELVDQFISPSHFLAQRFIDWGLPKEKMTVLENGRQIYPATPLRQLAPTGKRNQFGFFGQINPYKGALLILEAVEYLVKHNFSDFQVNLFGNIASGFPEFKAEFLEFLAKYQGLVIHHGKYHPAEIPELIQLVDWVIVPSIWWENSPLVIQEVLMHKRPIICSDIGGMAEKVTDQVTGLHFKVRNAVSLAKTINQACLDESIWSKLVNNITPRLSIEKSAKQHTNLYSSL